MAKLLAEASGMGPVGFAVGVGLMIGNYIYTRNREPIHNVVNTVVINPIVRILSAPKMKYDAITDANQPAVNEAKPFPLGDAQPRSSYKYECVASQANPQELVKVKFIENNQLTQEKKDKRKDDDNKDPDCRKCINDDIGQLLSLMKELSDLLYLIRLNIKCDAKANNDERKELFIKLTELLETLIHEHGAEFERNEEGIKLIPFVQLVTGESPPQIFLDKAIQEFFENIMTFFKKDSLEFDLNLNANIKGVIYCIQCQRCIQYNQEFNYVGQTINTMGDRGRTHFTVIKKKTCHLLHKHLEEIHRMTEEEINPDSLSKAYTIYLIHNLSNNATSPKAKPSCERKTDARIRRAWEMFYQWAFKAMNFDGGGSNR